MLDRLDVDGRHQTLQLKGAGLVSSVRGASGGYQLTRSPDEISLGEVMNVIGPGQHGIALYTATSASGDVHFHMLNPKTVEISGRTPA